MKFETRELFRKYTDDETFAKIYGDLLEPMEDPQILAAIETLK